MFYVVIDSEDGTPYLTCEPGPDDLIVFQSESQAEAERWLCGECQRGDTGFYRRGWFSSGGFPHRKG
jgi:hypothetical protein